MKRTYFLKQLGLLSLVMFVFSMSCRKNDTLPNQNSNTPVDDLTQVNASVSGIVLDENNIPLQGVLVKSGTATATTNAFGAFNFTNISLSKNNGSVTATKAGYFKGVRSFLTTAGKQHQVKLQLMKKVQSGTVNGATGGLINSNGTAKITFPPNAFVTSSGALYTGVVNVFSRWIDPTASNLPFIIPGDLRGINGNGAEGILTTYGMVGAELEDPSGNSLKIAPGKNATVDFPIPASIATSAPATIVLWHFDDATARWKEEGQATKMGNIYTATVNKFSFWNCDVPSAFINLDYTLVTGASSTPLASTHTRIKRLSNSTYGYGLTNSTGFVSGAVPKSENLLLEVVSECGTVVYSQAIGPFTSNTSLGNISTVVPASQLLTFSGTVVNCATAPVSNGYVSFYTPGGYLSNMATNATGAFSFSTINCTGGALAYSYVGIDNATSQQSAILSGSGATGAVSLGTINACGTSAVEFVNILLDGVPYNYVKPLDSLVLIQIPFTSVPGFTHSFTSYGSKFSASTFLSGFDLSVRNNNNTTNGLLSSFFFRNTAGTNGFGLIAGTASPVVFTSFGTLPLTFIEGSFTCQVLDGVTTRNVNCTFRQRRN